MAGCSQERCSKAADGHHPPAERRGSDGFERVLPCAVAYALDPCRRRSLGPTLELFVSFRPVAAAVLVLLETGHVPAARVRMVVCRCPTELIVSVHMFFVNIIV